MSPKAEPKKNLESIFENDNDEEKVDLTDAMFLAQQKASMTKRKRVGTTFKMQNFNFDDD